MNAALRRGVVSGIFVGGFVLLGVTTATSATADTGRAGRPPVDSTDETDGVGSGNQTRVTASAPVTARDNQATIVGDGSRSGGGQGATCAAGERTSPEQTSGEDGVASGDQTDVDACVPVTVSGNQTVVDPVVPAEVSGNQVTVVGSDNQNEPSEDVGPVPGDDGPGVGPGDGDDEHPGVSPGGAGSGDDSPGDTDVLPAQARAPAWLAAPRVPREVASGLPGPNPEGGSAPGPLALLLLGVACLGLAGRRRPLGRT